MHVVIIGNGIAGITAARFMRKNSDCRITVISEETDYFFSRTALMYIYMGDLTYEDTKPYEDWFWQKNRIDLVRDRVTGIDFDKKHLELKEKKPLRYDKLLLALGSENNLFGWPGQEAAGVQTLYSLQDLELMEENTQNIDRAAIVGGGLIGVEMAEMLHTRHIPVTFLVREPEYWSNVLPREEAAMVGRHIREYGIDLRLSTELETIIPDEHNHIKAVKTKGSEEIPCQFLGLTVGVHPNIDLVKDTPLEVDKGILVDDQLQTNIKDVYAAGDCAQISDPKPGRKPIEPVWYVGRMQGRAAGLNMAGKSVSYNPGVWFNSAKFFDIEYQVYGDIKPEPAKHEATLYWEHPNQHKSIRINYNKEDKKVIGFNLMGIRYRHQVCAKWIKEAANVEDVLKHLGMANFDPEFHSQFESALIQKYNEQNPGKNLTLNRKRGLFRNFFHKIALSSDK